jgi:hypothetical protein
MLESMEIGTSPSLSAETNMPDRFIPQLVTAHGDSIRAQGDTITNASGSTPLQGDLSDKPNTPKANMYYDGRSNKHKSALRGGDAEEGPKGFVQAESFTGTAGIAIAPIAGTLGLKTPQRKRKHRIVKPNGSWENIMRSDIDRLLNEWEPEFQAGEYDRGEHYMDHHGGEGVAGRKAKKAKAAGSSEMKNHGEPLGAKYRKTVAMCDVEENGVENEPQGVHQSSVGDPTSDDCCDELGHNWPDQPKHKGGGVAEPVAGNRYNDGGLLHGTSMEWSPSRIGRLMGGDADLQSLFNSYAKSTKAVCLEDFTALCDAHGIDTILDHTSLLKLMQNNRQYMFYEQADSDGIYYTKRMVNENQSLELDQTGGSGMMMIDDDPSIGVNLSPDGAALSGHDPNDTRSPKGQVVPTTSRYGKPKTPTKYPPSAKPAAGSVAESKRLKSRRSKVIKEAYGDGNTDMGPSPSGSRGYQGTWQGKTHMRPEYNTPGRQDIDRLVEQFLTDMDIRWGGRTDDQGRMAYSNLDKLNVNTFHAWCDKNGYLDLKGIIPDNRGLAAAISVARRNDGTLGIKSQDDPRRLDNKVGMEGRRSYRTTMNEMMDDDASMDGADESHEMPSDDFETHSVTIDGVKYVPAPEDHDASMQDEDTMDGIADAFGGGDDATGNEGDEDYEDEGELAEERMPKSLLKHFRKTRRKMGKSSGGGCY